MRLFLVLVFCTIALPRIALSQDYYILPYSHLKKMKDGTRSVDTRIKIYGYGIEHESGPGNGLDICLGGFLVEPKNRRLPLMSGLKGWGDIEPVDYQLEEFEKLRKRFVDEVQKKIASIEKLSDGSLSLIHI